MINFKTGILGVMVFYIFYIDILFVIFFSFLPYTLHTEVDLRTEYLWGWVRGMVFLLIGGEGALGRGEVAPVSPFGMTI